MWRDGPTILPNTVGLRRAMRRQVVARQALKNIDEILAAVALGVGVYYAVPADLVKVVWGTAAAALCYLVLARLALHAPAAAQSPERAS